MHLAEGEGGGSGSVDGGPGGVGALKGAGALKGGPEARAGANTVCSVPWVGWWEKEGFLRKQF